MKTNYTINGKNPLPMLILLMLVLSILSTLGVNVKIASAEEYPSIYMEPAYTDTTLTLGTNFTISIKTDYNGTDIQGWQFTLSYNPYVLHGVEVVNGDLITKDKHASALFLTGGFNNTEGKLRNTGAIFLDTEPADGVDVTSGPGTLANITFTVVGYGATPIAFGRGQSETLLLGWNATPTQEYPYGQGYHIIDAETMPTHIQDSLLINVQPIHDIAIAAINAPSQVPIGQTAQINVTIANEGNYTENGNLTLQYNTTPIDTKSFTLTRGEYKTIPFNWSTTGLDPGNYTLNVTATIPVDEDLTDNTNTTSIELKLAHNVVVTYIAAPSTTARGETISINVTVVNKGSFDESANVTLTYDDTLIDFQIKNIAAGDSATVEFNWNTTGLDLGLYTLNVTATIPVDEDLTDNTYTTDITLKLGYDLFVRRMTASPRDAEAGETVNITVIIENNGAYNATNFNLAVTYDTTLIENQTIPLLPTGESKTLTIIWDTTNIDPGSYTITTEAILATDEDPANNKKTGIVNLIVLHDIAITNVTVSTDTAKIGESISINVTVMNEGIENETVTVTVYYNDTQIGTQSITEMASGASQLLTFSWDTSNVTAGTYIIKAVATPVAGEMDTNDNTFTDVTVTIEKVPTQNILIYVAAAGAVIIIIMAVAIYLLKIRKPT
ncbi:hypothetical protein DRO69_03475 [Candidatus Bathyarchaeota archaeon]|nr:MAG: hypothetical protein DRO69_03475 [Candidatus Bathyarchaeota archaeon]